ncbi:MAG: hypothetical protein E7554_04250 [Ruminococcaceae bacterium]|nr:hypothetical protein [Oscillospiraceae bacterium]
MKQGFLLEFTKMILCGMAMPRSSENIVQALPVVAGDLEIFDTETGFFVGSEDPDCDFSVQDCAFSVASEVFGRNSYTDEFGGGNAGLTYVAQQLLEQYPDIVIEARHFLDSEWSNTVEIVKTADGVVTTEIEEL